MHAWDNLIVLSKKVLHRIKSTTDGSCAFKKNVSFHGKNLLTNNIFLIKDIKKSYSNHSGS